MTAYVCAGACPCLQTFIDREESCVRDGWNRLAPNLFTLLRVCVCGPHFGMSNVWVLVDSSHWCVPHVNPLPGFHGNSGTVARSGQRKPGTQLIAHRLTSCRPDFCDAVLISLRLSLSSLSDAWQFHFVIGYCVWCDLISPKSLKITQVHILHLCLLEFGLLKKYKKTVINSRLKKPGRRLQAWE